MNVTSRRLNMDDLTNRGIEVTIEDLAGVTKKVGG